MSRYFTRTLAGLKPYTPGEQLKMPGLIKLNTNENPYPPAPGVAAAVAAAVPDLRLYSDLTEAKLTAAAAKRWNISPACILCGNGSDENLLLAIRAFCDGEHPLACADVTYGFYPVLCDLLHVPLHVIPLEEDFSIDLSRYWGLDKKGEIIVIANPNAPTGLLAARDGLEEVVRRNPDTVVIVDEAYIDFAPEGSSCVPLVEKYDNLVVTQTFSKSRNLAGARLGLTFASPALIEDMNRVKFSYSPYNVNSLSEAAGAAAMEDEAYFRSCIGAIVETREWTAGRLRALGFTVLESASNFLFVCTGRMSGGALFETLRRRAILVRHFSAPRTENYLRITIGTPQQMQALVAALEEILNTEGENADDRDH